MTQSILYTTKGDTLEILVKPAVFQSITMELQQSLLQQAQKQPTRILVRVERELAPWQQQLIRDMLAEVFAKATVRFTDALQVQGPEQGARHMHVQAGSRSQQGSLLGERPPKIPLGKRVAEAAFARSRKKDAAQERPEDADGAAEQAAQAADAEGAGKAEAAAAQAAESLPDARREEPAAGEAPRRGGNAVAPAGAATPERGESAAALEDAPPDAGKAEGPPRDAPPDAGKAEGPPRDAPGAKTAESPQGEGAKRQARAAKPGERYIQASALVVKHTIRSGKQMVFDGDLVILGDVQAGARVRASGSIVVMGSLLGMAQAGARGDRQALVVAQRLQPVLLCIADKALSMRDQPEGEGPRIASIQDGEICIEAYQSEER